MRLIVRFVVSVEFFERGNNVLYLDFWRMRDCKLILILLNLKNWRFLGGYVGR